jgi:hypothetical protein
MGENCLRLVGLNARFRVEAVQLSERERHHYAVNSTARRGNKCRTLADPKGNAVHEGKFRAFWAEPFATQDVLIHEEPIEEDVGVP